MYTVHLISPVFLVYQCHCPQCAGDIKKNIIKAFGEVFEKLQYLSIKQYHVIKVSLPKTARRTVHAVLIDLYSK